jgi:protein-tyrosine-phosphatase
VTQDFPQSVLFCCDHNATRSPMAEGLMKRFYGHRAYVQSAGVKSEMEIDGFAIAVCAELGVELERHRVRSFDEMQEWGDDISGFDLIVALSPASQRRALDLTRHFTSMWNTGRSSTPPVWVRRGRPSSPPTGRRAIRSSVG